MATIPTQLIPPSSIYRLFPVGTPNLREQEPSVRRTHMAQKRLFLGCVNTHPTPEMQSHNLGVRINDPY